jgi:hypothetical protein
LTFQLFGDSAGIARLEGGEGKVIAKENKKERVTQPSYRKESERWR